MSTPTSTQEGEGCAALSCTRACVRAPAVRPHALRPCFGILRGRGCCCCSSRRAHALRLAPHSRALRSAGRSAAGAALLAALCHCPRRHVPSLGSVVCVRLLTCLGVICSVCMLGMAGEEVLGAVRALLPRPVRRHHDGRTAGLAVQLLDASRGAACSRGCAGPGADAAPLQRASAPRVVFCMQRCLVGVSVHVIARARIPL